MAASNTRSADKRKRKAETPKTVPDSGVQRPRTRSMGAVSPKKTFVHDVRSGITPPGVRGNNRKRVQAILRASKGWEAMHPGLPGKSKDDALVVEDYE